MNTNQSNGKTNRIREVKQRETMRKPPNTKVEKVILNYA